MGAMKRILEDAYNALKTDKDFQLMDDEKQYQAAARLAQTWINNKGAKS